MRTLLVALVCTVLWPAAVHAQAEPTPPAVDEQQAEPAKVDPRSFKFEIRSPDGAWKMRIGLTAQAWAVVEDAGPIGGERDRSFDLELRRVRPTLSGTAFTSDFSYLLHIALLPGKWEFMDMMVDYAFAPRLHLRVGQFKIPYTRYRIRSYKNRQVVDWAAVSTYFGAERQVGVLLHDGYDAKKPPRFEWALGVFTGTNARTAHAVGPSRLYEPDPDLEGRNFHPEIVGRMGYNHNGIDTTGEADLEGGPFRFSVSLSGTWDLAPVHAQDWALRGAVDALFKVRHFSLAATVYASTVQDGPSLGDQTPGALGVWAATGYVIGKRVEIAGQYAAVIPAGGTGTFHEPRAGVNVFILGRRVQWRTDFGAVIGCTGCDRDVDVQVRSIVQMSL
jgi:hypothetical protein